MDALSEGAKAPDLAQADDPLTRDVQKARAQLAQAIQLGGLKNDPLAPVLQAISTSLDVQQQLHGAAARTHRDAVTGLRQAVTEAIEGARQPVDADSLARIEKAAGKGADRHVAALVRAHNRRSVIIGSVVVATFVLGAGTGCYWWGRRDGISQFQVAEAGFSAMVDNDPSSATGWVNIVRLNDYQQLMVACHGKQGFVDQSGRRACMAALWLEPQKPATEPAAKEAKP